MSERFIIADVEEGLRQLPDESVDCVVTSPPYWGLRDYGVDGQIGLEPDFQSFVKLMGKVFEGVRRVLKRDGSLWLNLGDTYTGTGGFTDTRFQHLGIDRRSRVPQVQPNMIAGGDLKPKNLVGIPWRVALELQSLGWWLRSEIIWHKTSPMPESAKDRPTRAHEQLFLLSKSPTYYYDAESIKEKVTGGAHARGNGLNPKAKMTPAAWDTQKGSHRKRTGRYPKSKQNESFSTSVADLVETRNKRSVWKISAEPFPGAHYATFPQALVKPCIIAGCPPGGTVLDPFFGSGTVAVVCRRFGRNFIGIDIDGRNKELAEERLSGVTLAFPGFEPGATT